MKRILDQFIVSVVLALIRESDLPARTALEIITSDHVQTPRGSHRFISRDGDDLGVRIWYRLPCYAPGPPIEAAFSHTLVCLIFITRDNSQKLTYLSETNSFVICDF